MRDAGCRGKQGIRSGANVAESLLQAHLSRVAALKRPGLVKMTISKIDHNDGALEHVEVRHWDHGIVFGGGHYSTVGCVRGLDLRMDDCKVRIMIRRN